MSRHSLIFLLLLTLLGGFSVQARRFVLLFGSTDCDQCAALKEIWQQREGDSTAPVLVYVSIDNDDNYEYLKRLEDTLQIEQPGSSFPILLVGNRMVAGLEGFFEVIPELSRLLRRTPNHPILKPIQAAADSAETAFIEWSVPKRKKPAAQQPVAGAIPQQPPQRLLYLSNPGCQHCARQATELRILKERMPVTVEEYEVSTTDGQIMLQRVCQHFNLKPDDKNLAPIVIWSDGFISGRLAEAEELAAALEKTQNAEPFWTAEVTDAERQAQHAAEQEFLTKTTWVTAVLGGLIDGINPCAFATAIFLISYLLLKKRSPKYILAVGGTFCCGVFLAYLAFGIGLSFIVDWLGQFPIIRKSVYLLFAAAGVILALLHIRDALRFRKTGNAADMDMGLNAGTHRKIHDKIHRWTAVSKSLVIPGSLLLGVIVSSMELVCTGQIYLPMLVAINSQGFNLSAFRLLVVYNLAFILPLLGVTLMAYCGIGANSLAKWARNHVVATKFAMAGLFVLLAAIMVALAL